MSLLGVVVGASDYGEAHRIVRLLTASEGRVSLLARSARRSRKRFAGMLDVGTQVRVEPGRGRGDLRVISDIDRITGPKRARTDLDRIALLAYGCELCGALAAEGEPEPKLARLLEVWLEVLEGDATPGVASRVALEAKALTFAGVVPVLVACTVCGGPLEGDAHFDASGGGARHPRCGAGRGVRQADLEELEALRRSPLMTTVGAPAPRGAGLMWSAVRAHLGRTLRARALIDDLAGTRSTPQGDRS